MPLSIFEITIMRAALKVYIREMISRWGMDDEDVKDARELYDRSTKWLEDTAK